MQIVPDIWPNWSALAAELGCAYPTVHSWSHRGIPAKRFGGIIGAAKARGWTLSYQELFDFNARITANPPPQTQEDAA